jgi:hypothetical protein
MMENSSQTFRDLALALTEDERKQLRQRIATSLSLREKDSEGELATGSAYQSRDEVMKEEIPRLSLMQRVRFFFRRLFSARSDEHAYVEFRVAEVRRRALGVMPALRPMESHSVSASVAVSVWSLYQDAYPAIPLFLDLWRSGGYMQDCIEHLLDQRIPDSRKGLYEFASLEQLQEMFHKTERKGEVRQFVVRQIEQYVHEIPRHLLEELKEGLRPFYFMKQIATFSFNDLFEVFGFDPGVIPPEDTPPFRDAPTSAALPMLELLYLALYTTTKLDSDFPIHDELLAHYLYLSAREEQPESESSEAREVDESGIRRLRDHLRGLHGACVQFLKRVPLADMIRFYRRDPWMRIRPYVPAIRLEEFYQSSLMISVLTELDQRFPDVRKGVIERLKAELFQGEPPPMDFFRPGNDLLAAGSGPQRFTHILSVTLAFNFFRFVYRGRMQETFRILTRILPVRQRDSSSDLVTHISGLEEVHADIEDFDHSFSTESQDGKAYFRVRFGVETDATLARSYRSQVAQRDRESALLVDRTLEHIRGLISVVDLLSSGLTDQIRERYATSDTRANSVDGIDRLLDSHEQKLKLFERLMGHVRAMEHGN